MLPAVIAVAVLMPLTNTGVVESAFVPLPNVPDWFKPQHFTAPLASNPQVLLAPAATAVAVLIPITDTGVLEAVRVPLPNSP